jgi:hypothetical protein
MHMTGDIYIINVIPFVAHFIQLFRQTKQALLFYHRYTSKCCHTTIKHLRRVQTYPDYFHNGQNKVHHYFSYTEEVQGEMVGIKSYS